MSSVTRRLAVVTGGSTGIGRGIVNALAHEGWNVAFSYLGRESEAEETAARARAAGADILYVACDVGVKAQVDAFYDQVDQWHGAPDLLVNNAGIQTWAPLLEVDEESWDAVIRTNLKGSFLNTQNAARRMIAAGKAGAIINIGSGCNRHAFPRLVAYTASKGGVEQLTKVSAVELGPYGIRVNCVAPGAIEIERTQAETDDYAGEWSPITPLRRVGQPKDVADIVSYLASPGASFITGQTVWVDGGVFSRANWPYPETDPA